MAASADFPADAAGAVALYERIAPAAIPTPSSATPAARTSADSAASRESAGVAGTDSPAPAISPPKRSPLPPVVTKTVILPDTGPELAPPSGNDGYPPSTTEIPGANGNSRTGAAEHQQANAMVVDYATQQDPRMFAPRLHSLQDFMREGGEISPLGLDLYEAQRKLDSGEVANGLLIVGVRQGSAAAKSGLHANRRTARDILEGVAVAAALFFPPAMFAVPVIEQVKLGESYDMIIGVDGTRVVSYAEFEDSMRDIEPGEIVYLSIVRNGKRVQVPVHVGSLSYAPF
jgi:PDZ domain